MQTSQANNRCKNTCCGLLSIAFQDKNSTFCAIISGYGEEFFFINNQHNKKKVVIIRELQQISKQMGQVSPMVVAQTNQKSLLVLGQYNAQSVSDYPKFAKIRNSLFCAAIHGSGLNRLIWVVHLAGHWLIMSEWLFKLGVTQEF